MTSYISTGLTHVRNYLGELFSHREFQQKIHQSSQAPSASTEPLTDSDLRRYEFSQRDQDLEQYKTSEFVHNIEQELTRIRNLAERKNEPFDLRIPIDLSAIPENRQSAPGIRSLPFRYHKTNPTYATEEVPETGYSLHPLLAHLLRNKYPLYEMYTDKYCRPLGTTEATFRDFNHEQLDTAPVEETRKWTILSLIQHFLNCTPYRPIHFVDTTFDKRPLHTGTGYFNRNSPFTRVHAAYAHVIEYALRPFSKGYFYNTTYEYSRSFIHFLKKFGYPFPIKNLSPEAITDSLRQFFLDRPTLLFTRNHISDRDGILKQRPVYAVDDFFLIIESMLTFPLLVMARTPDCCIMQGLETIRGANRYLDKLARSFTSFFTIDWSRYDQSLPRAITDIYYTDFLESLIIISHGYQPTVDYPSSMYADLTPELLFGRMTHLLHFLHTWYNNMVFVTSDGFAYLRSFCGVPSGLFNTQYLDSFGNLFLIIDGLLEFGIPPSEIKKIVLFVMGDDNSGFTHWEIFRLHAFIAWFESYASKRWNMTLSRTKSIVTSIRGKIETLSYQCNYGDPIRPLGKLVAQLCYPEHGIELKYQSARAIGIAFAAAGMDPTFHQFCKDVYYTFLPYADSESTATILDISKYLPGSFKILDAYQDIVDLSHFPTLWEVRHVYSYYHGPLSYAPKWNEAHFTSPPNELPPGSITMLEFRNMHKIERKPVPSIF
jgi:hypothetical protein